MGYESSSDDEDEKKKKREKKHPEPSYLLGGTTPRFAPHGGVPAPSNPSKGMASLNTPGSYYSSELDAKYAWKRGPKIFPLPPSESKPCTHRSSTRPSTARRPTYDPRPFNPLLLPYMDI